MLIRSLFKWLKVLGRERGRQSPSCILNVNAENFVSILKLSFIYLCVKTSGRWIRPAEELITTSCCIFFSFAVHVAKLTWPLLKYFSLVIHVSKTNSWDGWSCAFLVLPHAFTSNHMSLIELMGFWHETKGARGGWGRWMGARWTREEKRCRLSVH